MTTYHSQTGKFVAAIAQNLPQDISDDVMQGWIENPKALQNVLRSALCPPTETAEFEALRVTEIKAWKQIKLGIGLGTADGFRKAIINSGLRISDWAIDMLANKAFTAAIKEQEIDLVVMSVKELGFKRITRYHQICARAKELGLELCPAEVGPQLRLQYLDQPKNEWLVIAMMEGIRDSSGHGLFTFCVGHNQDGRWLRVEHGYYDCAWDLNEQFVFVLPRK